MLSCEPCFYDRFAPIVLKNSKIEQRKKSRESRCQGISAAVSLVSATAGAVIDFG
jgi:hypothetical protein